MRRLKHRVDTVAVVIGFGAFVVVIGFGEFGFGEFAGRPDPEFAEPEPDLPDPDPELAEPEPDLPDPDPDRLDFPEPEPAFPDPLPEELRRRRNRRVAGELISSNSRLAK